jgi:hypothetical protein
VSLPISEVVLLYLFIYVQLLPQKQICCERTVLMCVKDRVRLWRQQKLRGGCVSACGG